MKGILTKEGRLKVERNGVLKPQLCNHVESRFCGDWCSLFQELREESPNNDLYVFPNCGARLGYHYIEIVEDNRNYESDEGEPSDEE